MRKSSDSALVVVGVFVAGSALAAVPEPVSPGGVVEARCPAFSWSLAEGASGYEVVVYPVTEAGEVEDIPVVSRRLPAGASSWTPSGAGCLEPGGRYAWAVRARTGQGAGAWSEPLLFETPGTPTQDEVRQALGTLRRYQRGPGNRELENPEPGKPGPAASDPQPTTGPGGRSRRPTTGRAAGDEALTTPTVGAGLLPRAVTAPADFSLSIDGDFELGGFVFKNGIPFLHNDGGAAYGNTALGLNALVSATPGSPESFSGERNSAFGDQALRKNTTGSSNTASGYGALEDNTSGSENTASGGKALRRNIEASRNTAVGYGALANTKNGSNTAIGHSAGVNWTFGSSNIAVGVGASGVAGETGTIRIGGEGFQTETFIEGISGATATGGAQVFINSSNQLGTATSSARFKQDIHDLEGVSDQLLDLRPVSFRYKDEIAKGGENPIEYGLLAEEVAEIFPDLVVNDEQGRPYTVRYHLLTPLLLGEIQRQEGELADLRRIVADQEQRLERLSKKRRFR